MKSYKALGKSYKALGKFYKAHRKNAISKGFTENTGRKTIKRLTQAEIEKAKKIILDDLIEEVKKFIQDELNDERVIIRKSTNPTSTRYIGIYNLNGRYYEIRITYHTHTDVIPKKKDKQLNCRYKYNNHFGFLFIIEASIFNYHAEDIINTIRGIENSFTTFESKSNEIKEFVNRKINEKGKDVVEKYLESFVYSQDVSMKLAGIYMEENGLNDNEYNTDFLALSNIIDQKLEELEESDWKN